jgi:glycosyltransferase involved in cell wall biosynthesis
METYEQCLESYRSTNDPYFLVESITFQQGAEGPLELIKHYFTRGKHSLVCMYWELIKTIPGECFPIVYYVSCSAKAIQNIELTAQLCLCLFKHREKISLSMLSTIVENVKYVLPFAKPHFLESFRSFVDFYHLEHDYIPKHTNSLLFFVGDFCDPWNYTYGLTNAVGGSEQAIRYLTQHFKDYNVYVCGNVTEEVVGNVHYVHTSRIGELIMANYFDAIIISRNISFLELCPTHYADRLLLMAHDVELYGVNDVHATLQKYKIDACVCLTKFHQQLFLERYPYLPIAIIPNGIEPSFFVEEEKEKIANRFLFTSCSERGLAKLIDLWPSILEKKPDATLRIASYQPFPRDHDVAVKEKMDAYPSIQHIGKLTPQALYEEMAVAEYWLFPSTFLETSCITAREMMASKVKCYYYPVGGITETMGGFGVPMVEGNELAFQEYDLEKAKEYALSFSWERSAALWTSLIKVGVNPYNPETPPDNIGVTGDEADLPGRETPTTPENLPECPYIEVDSTSIVGVNNVEQPYVEVDSTGFIVKGDEAEIINL